MISTIHAQYKGALGATRAPETAFLPSQSAWWRHAKRGFLMSLLLPTATQATPTIRYRLIIYKEWVAEVEVFVAKKVFQLAVLAEYDAGVHKLRNLKSTNTLVAIGKNNYHASRYSRLNRKAGSGSRFYETFLVNLRLCRGKSYLCPHINVLSPPLTPP